MKTLHVAGILVLAAIAIGAAAMLNITGKASGGQEIKIGFIGPLTGDAGAYGLPAQKIIALAADEINSQGGIDGRNITIIYEDGKCNGAASATAMQKFAEIDRVQVVLGGMCSSESLGAEPVATQARVFLFSYASSSPDLTNKSRFFARNYPSDASQGSAIAETAYAKGWKKVALIQEQTDYTQGIYNSFSARFTTLGGTILKEEVSSQTTDFRTTLAKLKDSNPDALFLDTQTSAVGERIMKQMEEMNWRPNLLISDTILTDTDAVKRNAAFLEGAIGAEMSVGNNPKFVHMISAYKARYGTDAQYLTYAQTEYDSVYMIRDAIKAVGYDGEKIADYVRNMKDWQGASGSVTIGQNGDRIGGHTPEIIRNGTVTVLAAGPSVKIGLSIPLTGNLAFLGEATKNGALLAKEKISGTKYTYDLVFEDDRMDPLTAAKTSTKLIEIDKVNAIISISSGVGNAISPITEQNKVIHFSIASDPNIAVGTYNFIHWTPPEEEVKVWLEEAQRRGIKRVAVIFANQQGFIATGDLLKSHAPEYNVQLVSYDTFNIGDRDFRTTILKAQETRPDAYLLGAFSPEIELLVTQMNEAGIRNNISSIESFELSDRPELFEGYWYVTAAEASNSFRDEYIAKFGKLPTMGAANSYDIINLLVNAFEKAGDGKTVPTETAAVNELVNTRNFTGALGMLNIDSDGIVHSRASVRMIQSGKPVTIG